jgi:hypothetical protein
VEIASVAPAHDAERTAPAGLQRLHRRNGLEREHGLARPHDLVQARRGRRRIQHDRLGLRRQRGRALDDHFRLRSVPSAGVHQQHPEPFAGREPGEESAQLAAAEIPRREDLPRGARSTVLAGADDPHRAAAGKRVHPDAGRRSAQHRVRSHHHDGIGGACAVVEIGELHAVHGGEGRPRHFHCAAAGGRAHVARTHRPATSGRREQTQAPSHAVDQSRRRHPLRTKTLKETFVASSKWMMRVDLQRPTFALIH